MKVVRWFFITITAIVGVALALTGVGMTIDPGHTATRYAVYKAAPAQIWALVSDPARTTEWRSDVERVEQRPEAKGNPVWVVHGKSNPFDGMSTDRLVLTRVESSGDRRFVFRTYDDALHFSAEWLLTLSDADGGTRVTITEKAEIENPFWRGYQRYVYGYGANLESWLEDLGDHLGEKVRVEET